MNKKAFSSQLFNWIFIIIAGSLLLIFFVRFAFQQTQIFGEKGSVELISSLEDQLEAFSISETSSKIISLGYNTNLELDCERIVNENIPKRTNLIIFSPSKLSGKSVATWTRKWEFPYQISNVFYLTNENSRYLLIYDKDSFEKVSKFDFPSSFNLQKMNFDNLNLDDLAANTKNLQNLNLVYFTKIQRPTEILNKFKNLNLVEIDLKLNEIKIFNKDGTFTSSYFLEEPLLFGAIFGSENFNCIKDKALSKLDLVTEVYLKKASYLSLKTSNQLCKAKYYEITNTLTTFKGADSKQILYDLKEKIKSQNKGLEKNACPSIY